ncbi:MAG: phosphoribosylpyrophosphate synthetase [Maribacter sp.]
MILSQSNTMTQDIEAARKEGYTMEFYFRNEKVHCRNTLKKYGRDECVLVEYCRHEGMNDPGDGSILFLIQCIDGSKGYLTSGYGIYADTDTVDFILSLKRLNKI